MKPVIWLLHQISLVLSLTAIALAPVHRAHAAPLPAPDVTRGICVVIGDPQCEVALNLARRTELLIFAQMPDRDSAERARRIVADAGFYGSRIYIDSGSLSHLLLGDDVADALIAPAEETSLAETEALRVIHPHAAALLGARRVVKSVPTGVDDWSHPYHGPDNNPVSHDQVARGPYLTQFLSDPRYAPLPQLAVASAGRVFKAFGHIAFKAREEPWLNTLAAFNGYNGTLLWRREIPAALMVHRSTLIATPSTVYFGDDKSCKVIDAATGELRDQIIPAVGGDTFWKWMAIENGTLYALIGGEEERDPTIRTKSESHGWPWNPLSPGYNKEEHTWGFGHTLLAIELSTKKVLWQHRESDPVDSRALCMRNGRIFAFRFGAYLACLDAKTGAQLWRRNKADGSPLFTALGSYSKRQDWRTNWRTTAYVKAGERALYFAGPTIGKLLAISTDGGHVMWEHPYDNYQLVLRDDALYALPGQIDSEPARKFDPVTGKVLEEIALGRRACTRATASIDAVFCRANGGSTRLDAASSHPQLVSPMRPNCHDGVTVANGLLYWWPSVCDCNLTLYGITALAPAGLFDFSSEALPAERLETFPGQKTPASFPQSPADWPVFRANNTASAASDATIPRITRQSWNYSEAASFVPTAPVAVGEITFIGGSDGIVRAIRAATGTLAWRAFTGGAIRHPPTIADGRAFVGSADGWLHVFEAKTGRPLWRFRAAPAERRIPVYGQLQSTWPASSGVVVADGVAYIAAGIVNYDGTHVYALDAATGAIKWQNNSSGHLDPEQRSGVSVQGHLLLRNGKLYLAGGNAVSPAIYDVASGKCLNDIAQVQKRVNNNVPGSFSPRGSDLYVVGSDVLVAGKPFYGHPQYDVYDASVMFKTLLAPAGDHTIAWMNNSKLMAYPRGAARLEEKVRQMWARPGNLGLQPLWETACKDSLAIAVGQNAAVVATRAAIAAHDMNSGATWWTQPLPSPAVPWGLALDRAGRVLVSLENGHLLCFTSAQVASRR